MAEFIEIKVWPDQIDDFDQIKERARKKVKSKLHLNQLILVKRSIDARGRRPKYIYRFKILKKGEVHEAFSFQYQKTNNSKRVIIVGAGPCGYFAALRLLELNIKPILLERGKDVRKRRIDLKNIQQKGIVNEHSNYCFGEGGAGTYSDGKLYTRSKKRGDIIGVLKQLVDHGANPEILYEAHPHIGSNKLPKIIAAIRETILKHGGEIHFDHHVNDLIIKDGQLIGVVVKDKGEFMGDAVLLATGHSARDIYKLLHAHCIEMQRKPFALGVRIEHPQPLIDQIQYNQKTREEGLPASSYRLACTMDDRGVFSFCMCPGGLVIPAATAPGEIVVNGMSLSRRDSPYANSGTVVAVNDKDYERMGLDSIFGGLAFQQQVEQAFFNAGDGSQMAPAQRLTDFVNGKISSDLNNTSYIPGLLSAPVHEILPEFIYKHLKMGILEFDKKMKGYFTESANVIGTESRTSAPIKIPRELDSLMHPQMKGLFPAGEGAGYAGGIMSAAMDGQRVADAIKTFID
ncbi:MAG: FAD-dependent protein [Bacteroidota bacterium]